MINVPHCFDQPTGTEVVHMQPHYTTLECRFAGLEELNHAIREQSTTSKSGCESEGRSEAFKMLVDEIRLRCAYEMTNEEVKDSQLQFTQGFTNLGRPSDKHYGID